MNELMKIIKTLKYEAKTDGITRNEGYLVDMVELVVRWADSKGRYHSQIASADLMKMLGRHAVYPGRFHRRKEVTMDE